MKNSLKKPLSQMMQAVTWTLIACLGFASSMIGSGCSVCISCTGPCQTTTFAAPSGQVPITLPEATDENQPSSPCPSIIQVSGLPSCHVISNLTVKLEGMTFVNTNLLTVALVSPCGCCAVLINNISEPQDAIVDNFFETTLCINDCFTSCFPRTATGIDIPDGKYKPADYGPGNYCFGTNGCSFSTKKCAASTRIFKGKSPLGTWKLFTCVKPGDNESPGEMTGWKLIFDHCLPCKPTSICSKLHSSCCQSCNISKPILSPSCCPINCATACCGKLCRPCTTSGSCSVSTSSGSCSSGSCCRSVGEEEFSRTHATAPEERQEI